MDKRVTNLPDIDPFLLSILSNRLLAVIREMTNTVVKTSRSAVIKNSRDFSCGLLTYDHRLLGAEESLPIHVAALEYTTQPIEKFFDDIEPGDAFLNNCPYTGGTHHADMTICVPVFVDGEPLFWTLCRAHHADIGAPIPTTYLTEAATIYEEGLHFPCVRIQRNYTDLRDIVRICQMKIRSSHLWYGDYLAQVAACRFAEKRLCKMVTQYGRETVLSFIESWMNYGIKRTRAEIARLPAGTWTYRTIHDQVPNVAEQGIPVRVSVSVDPDAGEITVDARDNGDCVKGGLNLSEACAIAACRIGVFYNLDSTIPHNQGSASCIRTQLRDGCVVGRPIYPAGTSVATTNVNSRLITAVSSCFAEMGTPHGRAEFGYSMCLGEAVISGKKHNGDPYVNQVLLGYSGGPASHGADGWLTTGAACDGGQMALDSIEINESMYPILVESRKAACDSIGHGEWDGAPGMTGTYRAHGGELIAIYGSDGDSNAPRGVLGGNNAAPSCNWKRSSNGNYTKLPSFHDESCQESEALVFRSCGGGGYGNPLLRNPGEVLASVNRDWISPKMAEEIYRVVVMLASN